MDKKTSIKLLGIASLGLCVAGLIMLLVEIFSETKDNTLLCLAFVFIILANLFNIIRAQLNKKE